jgi:hypothetical protein
MKKEEVESFPTDSSKKKIEAAVRRERSQQFFELTLANLSY